jgi:hypothetical protein
VKQRPALRRDRGLGSRGVGHVRGRDAPDPDHDPGRRLQPPRRPGAAGREAGPGSRLEVHVLRRDPRGRGGCDAGRAAGVDAPRLARFAGANPFGPSIDHGVYGETVAAYYTLAWLDRYVAASATPTSRAAERRSKALAENARRRLTASGTDRFDRSADAHSIGSGFFDADKADTAKTPEAGNVPVTIRGIPVRNLLSFQYDSRYHLDGGALQCDDMRAGCP